MTVRLEIYALHIIRKIIRYLIVLALLSGAAVVVAVNYSYIFSKKVKGRVVGIERVTNPSTLIGQGAMNSSQIFSFAVAIQDAKGEIWTASSEDRQWAVVEKGQCAEALFFPYPPWDFEKGGTFFGARLLRQFSDCAAPDSIK